MMLLSLLLTACLQTITLLGPMFGFLLGSYCAKLYVDIGNVEMGKCNVHSSNATEHIYLK